MQTKKIALGITGASGSIYANVLLNSLSTVPNLEVAIVMSKNAKDVWQLELGNTNYENYQQQMFD